MFLSGEAASYNNRIFSPELYKRMQAPASALMPDQLGMVLNHMVRANEWKRQELLIRQVYDEIWPELWINQSVHERVLARAGESARREVVHGFGVDPVTQGRK
jgi:hypothetical protein